MMPEPQGGLPVSLLAALLLPSARTHIPPWFGTPRRDPDRAGGRPSMTVSSSDWHFRIGPYLRSPRLRSSAVIGRLNWTFWAEMPRLVFTRVAIGLLQLLGHLLFILASAPGGPVCWPGLDQSYA
jgi:hypothetical protein